MVEKTLKIGNKLGLHLRAAAVLIELANKFKCEVYLRKDDRRVNAKSIMGLMTLGAAYDTFVTIETQGEDEEAAVVALSELIEKKFGEKE